MRPGLSDGAVRRGTGQLTLATAAPRPTAALVGREKRRPGKPEELCDPYNGPRSAGGLPRAVMPDGAAILRNTRSVADLPDFLWRRARSAGLALHLVGGARWWRFFAAMLTASATGSAQAGRAARGRAAYRFGRTPAHARNAFISASADRTDAADRALYGGAHGTAGLYLASSRQSDLRDSSRMATGVVGARHRDGAPGNLAIICPLNLSCCFR